MLSVQQIITKITPKLHGTTLSKVAGIYDKFHEAASQTLLRIDPPDTIQRYRIDNAIYDKIYNYTCPTDFKGLDKVVDIRPINRQRNRFDDQTDTFSQEFDKKKALNSMTVEDIAGVKTLRISKKGSGVILLNDFDALQSYITSSGDVTSPVIDTLDYVSGFGSYSFGLSGATGQGKIIVQLPNVVDLTRIQGLGSLFAWFQFPDVTRFTSFVLKFGQDANNNWSKVITVPQGRTALDSAAWDLMPADWRQVTQNGTPTPLITYLEIDINYTVGAALTYVKLDSVTAQLGRAYEMLYYSQNIFMDVSTGMLKEIPTEVTDIVTLDMPATEIFMKELLKPIYEELKGRNMSTDIGQLRYELEGDGRVLRGSLIANRAGLYRDYISQYPSQAIPRQTDYYEFDELSGY